MPQPLFLICRLQIDINLGKPGSHTRLPTTCHSPVQAIALRPAPINDLVVMVLSP